MSVPETILKKRRRDEKLAAERAAARLPNKKALRQKKAQMFKSAEKHGLSTVKWRRILFA